MPHTMDDYLNQLPADMRHLVQGARRLWREALPDAEERFRPGWGLIGYNAHGYLGFVIAYPDRIQIGFEHGTALPDPAGILEGCHLKRVRYVSIRSESEMHQRAPLLVELCRSAEHLNIARRGYTPHRSPKL